MLSILHNDAASGAALADASAESTISIVLTGFGRVEVVGAGQWTPAYADEHFARLEGVLHRARSGVGSVRVLVDLRRAGVQPAATAERIKYWTARLYGANDRVAIVVGSSLMKVQMRRVATVALRELFLSEMAARTWLLA